MKILVLTIHYWQEKTGIGAVITRRCEHLASIGYEVVVSTAMPFYPQWRTHPGYANKVSFREEHNGVKILRSWIWVPKTVSSAKRVVLETSFLAGSLLQALRNAKPDLLLLVSPPLGLGMSAVLLSRWWHVPYVFDVEDLQPDAAGDLGMLPRPLLPVLYRLESMAYRNAALISTLTEGMRQKIVGKGVPDTKVVVVPPPADNRLFDVGSVVDGQRFRKKHGLEGKFIVAHSGNMGVKQGLNVVLDAALRLKMHQEIMFLLSGDGVMKSHLKMRANALGLCNVRFLPVQEHADFLEMLAAIDMALIVQQSAVSDIVFPSKTVTLLSAARPVVASVSANCEIGRVIRQSQAGVVIEPESPDPLVAAIRDMFENPEGRFAMGQRGRRYALQHWDEARILDAFDSKLLEASAVG
jgi:colanic acid biosynthesis glycosyl transferase WcaI